MSRKKHNYSYISAISTLLLIAVFAGLLSIFNASVLIGSLLIAIFFTSLVFLLDIKWGLFLLLILRPILDFSSEISIFEFAGSSMNLASILGICVILLLSLKVPGKFEKIKTNPLLKPWLIFLFILAIGITLSFNQSASIAEFVRIFSIFSLFILGFIAIKTKGDLLELTMTLIASMIIPSIIAFYQLITNTGLSLSYQDVPNRLFGTFAHPNLFAFSLTFSIALSLGMFFFSNKPYQKWLHTLSFSTFLILLILTYTRGAWILFAFMILIAGVLKLRKLLFFSALTFFIIYLLFPLVHERVNSITTLSPYSSISWRFELWKDGLEYSKEALLLGHGTGTSEELILERRGSHLGSSAPHNDFLRILLENGLFGLVAFLGIFLSLSWKLLKEFLARSKQNDELSFLFLLFLCFTIGLYAASFGDNIINATSLQWAFWAEAGAILSYIKATRS
jgi:O-antigen ligase